MKTKIKISTLMALMFLLLVSVNCNAYQSVYNNGNWKTDGATNWLRNIRNMETSGEILGLNETINDTTYISSSGSNNIDVHMIKNTEVGTMEILAVSQYGKQPIDTDTDTIKKSRWIFNTATGIANLIDASTKKYIVTTTGNRYGIYLGTDTPHTQVGIYVAAFNGGISGNIDDRYVIKDGSRRVGDGLGETEGWQSASYGYGITSPYVRTFGGSIFNRSLTNWSLLYNSYACIVNGEGI